MNSAQKGIIVRKCIPFDLGPSRRYGDGRDRYHLFDLDSPDGAHPLSILPDQLIELKTLGDQFEPGCFVTWPPPYLWWVKRDWGSYS